VSENRPKIEKSASIKTLVLLLKPLEETIKLCGLDSDKLPTSWRNRISTILKIMNPIFPIQKKPTCMPPNSLLESFVQLHLLIDEDFQTTKKLKFEQFFMLFTIVQVQLMSGKANQSALVMAKLIDYFKYV